jgi:DNA polymerase I-like protein with 3'-5' exonuclease and polymerase domains
MATNAQNETGPITWVLDEEGLDWLSEQILGASEIVVDLETTGLTEHAVEGGHQNGGVGARISLASFTLPQAERGAFGERRWNGETPTTWILPCSHPDSVWRAKWKRILFDLLQPAIDARIPFVNQNMKFDSRWLYARCGVDCSSLITWDTKDAQHLIDENESTKLKVAWPRIAGIPPWDDFDLSTPGASERVPLLDLGAYAARDTWHTWCWMRWQRSTMFLDGDDEPFDRDDRNLAKIGKLATWIAMPTVGSLTKVEQRGMKLDVEWTKQQLAIDTKIASDTLDEMAEYAGLDRKSASAAPTSYWFRDFTDIAVQRNHLRVASLTAGGKPQWSKNVLNRQARNGSDIATLILKHRQASKRAEFYRSWLELVSPAGYIHANFNSGSVRTGRLSSSNPNLQQVSKKQRPAFIAREGYVLADFDYSQIELRVAAFVSRSLPMIKAFQNGEDLHRLMGALIIEERNKAANHAHRAAVSAGTATNENWEPLPEHIDPDSISADDRQAAKAANFGLLYEMGAFGFKEYAETAYGVVLTIEEAVLIHAAFFKKWEGMKDWHNKQKTDAHRDGYVVSPLGRMRRLPNIWDGNDKMVSFAERQAINSPVQSMASDLLQLAMASIQGLLPAEVNLPKIEGAYPVATVHDSIVVELEAKNWRAIADQVAERMQSLDQVLAKFGVDFDVPLLADYSVGTRWSLSDVSDPQSAPETLPSPSEEIELTDFED